MKEKKRKRKSAKENLLDASVILLVLFLLAVFIGLYISWMFGARDAIMLCSGIVIGTCFYYMVDKILRKKFLPLYGKYKGIRQGEGGEATVTKALKNNLANGNLILSDVMLEENSGNIDHIVIGQYGVIVIETKTHRGKIVCYGDDWFQDRKIGEETFLIKLPYSPSKQAKSNALRLKNFLMYYYPEISKKWIRAMVVYPNKKSEGDTIERKTQPMDCEIFDSIDTMIDEIKKEKVTIKLTFDDLTELKNIFEKNAKKVKDITITN
jgi:hypothetical protein